MIDSDQSSRRVFLRKAAIASGGMLVMGLPAESRGAARSQPTSAAANKTAAEGISPAEDLMREHGALARILLAYDEAARRIEAKAALPPEPLAKATDLVRRFVQEYHEKLEEDFLFPRFEKAGKLADLTDLLRAQHRVGRRVTDEISRRATETAIKSPDESRKLVESLRAFTRMYRPHKAREDTVLFPAFHTIVSPREYDALGDEFEDREHDLFGANGFEKVVEEVAAIEKTLGLYDLAQFTAQV